MVNFALAILLPSGVQSHIWAREDCPTPCPTLAIRMVFLSFEFFRIWKMEEFQTDLMTLSMSSILILE